MIRSSILFLGAIFLIIAITQIKGQCNTNCYNYAGYGCCPNDYSSCCPTTHPVCCADKKNCCPTTHPVCCPNQNTCCPSGYVCIGNNLCASTSKSGGPGAANVVAAAAKSA